MLDSLIWYERYRPSDLSQVALTEENRAILQSFLDKKEIPHLLLHGPAGTGKTTVSKILCNALDASVLTLNASNERGIDVVRDKIGQFVRTMGLSRWRIVFLDEADAMTSDAQFAMRNLIETFSQHARFILTANHLHKIIDPLQSRCTVVMLSEMPVKERVRVLMSVLQAEGVQADPMIALGYAQRFKDMRKILSSAQRSIQSKSALVPVTELTITGADLLQHVYQKNFAALKAAVNDPSFDAQQAFREMFWAVSDSVSAPRDRAAIARALTDSQRGVPDQVIHFLGTCAEMMQ